MNGDRERLIATAADPVVRGFLRMADDSSVAILPYALSIAVRLGVADECHAEHGGSAKELAKSLNVAPDNLERLLRALAGCGFFAEDEQGCFRLTGLGELLRGDSPLSMVSTLRNVDSYRAWLDAVDTITTGRPAFDAAFGTAFFSHKEGSDQAGAEFDHRMQERSDRLYPGLTTLEQWKTASRVMDIGGGSGTVLASILEANRHLRGILFDRPDVIRRAHDSGTLAGLDDRCELAAGDFFGPGPLPSAADAHLLCSVLHDWEDEAAVEILRRSARALPDGGRLYICEMILPDRDADPEATAHPAYWSDLGMMVVLGGRERTADQYRALLAAAGMRLVSVSPLPGSFFSLFEARPDASTSLAGAR